MYDFQKRIMTNVFSSSYTTVYVSVYVQTQSNSYFNTSIMSLFCIFSASNDVFVPVGILYIILIRSRSSASLKIKCISLSVIYSFTLQCLSLFMFLHVFYQSVFYANLWSGHIVFTH